MIKGKIEGHIVDKNENSNNFQKRIIVGLQMISMLMAKYSIQSSLSMVQYKAYLCPHNSLSMVSTLALPDY